MEQLVSLIKDYWVIALLLVLIVMLFQVFVRGMLRLVSLFIAIGAILVLVLNYSPEQVVNLGRSMVESTNEALRASVLPIMEAELKDASYQFHDDGTYEVRTASIRIVGKKGETTATVYYKGQQFQIDIGQLGGFFQEQLKQANVIDTSM